MDTSSSSHNHYDMQQDLQSNSQAAAQAHNPVTLPRLTFMERLCIISHTLFWPPCRWPSSLDTCHQDVPPMQHSRVERGSSLRLLFKFCLVLAVVGMGPCSLCCIGLCLCSHLVLLPRTNMPLATATLTASPLPRRA